MSTAALTLLAWAGTPVQRPWKERPWREWDRADVRKILYDSPWARHSVQTKRDMEFDLPDPGPTGNELRGYHAKESIDDHAVTTEYYVRWVSSRTMREAWLRRESLLAQSSMSGQPTPAALDEFELAVGGRDLSIFENVPKGTLQKKSFLAVSDSRGKIVPNEVEITRSGDGKVRSVLFRFPKRTATGEPVIAKHETKVWFFAQGENAEIRVTFYPQTMMDNLGMDL
jgi:hypothetical protein